MLNSTILFAASQAIQPVGLSNVQRTRTQTVTTTTSKTSGVSSKTVRSGGSSFSTSTSSTQSSGVASTLGTATTGGLLSSVNSNVIRAPTVKTVTVTTVTSNGTPIPSSLRAATSDATASAISTSSVSSSIPVATNTKALGEQFVNSISTSPANGLGVLSGNGLTASSSTATVATATPINSPVVANANILGVQSTIPTGLSAVNDLGVTSGKILSADTSTARSSTSITSSTKALGAISANKLRGATSAALTAAKANTLGEIRSPIQNTNALLMRQKLVNSPTLVTFSAPKATITTTTSGETTKLLSKAKSVIGLSSSPPATVGEIVSITSRTTPSVIIELRQTHERLKDYLEKQAAEINVIKSTIPEQMQGWYFKSPELNSAFQEALATLTTLLESCQTYMTGGEKLLSVLEDSDLEAEWIERVNKLHNSAEVALTRSVEIMKLLERLGPEIAEDNIVYKEAKAQQTRDSKATMENELNELLQQTLQVGHQANNVIVQAKKEWAAVLRSQLGEAKANVAIARINEITGPVQADLAHLTPEDLEKAMNDAHRCIEDIKGLFHAYKVPVLVIRQTVNPVQMATFSTITKAKNIHTLAITNLK